MRLRAPILQFVAILERTSAKQQQKKQLQCGLTRKKVLLYIYIYKR